MRNLISLNWPRVSTIAAFLVPGLALSVPSGYSWGAVLLLLASLLAVHTWWRRSVSSEAYWLIASVVCMGLVWALDIDPLEGWRSADRAVKYLMILPCWLYLLAQPPAPHAVLWGVLAGAVGSGLVALYQSQVLMLGRVTGFTNAIQYGNLSILLALMCALWLAASGSQLVRWQRMALVLALALGGVGSLLSQSRGGWLALALSLPLWAYLLAHWRSRRLVLHAVALLCVAVALIATLKGGEVRERFDEAYRESAAYIESGSAHNSIGQRLDHWRLAFAMGIDRPVLGWGQAGYIMEKNRRVAAGLADPVVLQFGHAHSELLDIFAKRGLVGVCALLFFYAVPLALFWPTERRVGGAPGQAFDRTALALCLVGMALPVGYFGFGLTQAFLAHNSGNMFYLFMVPLCFAALQGRATVRNCTGL